MNRVSLLLYVFILIFLVSCSEQNKEQVDRGYHIKVGDIVDNIHFTLTDSTKLSLDKLEGKVVVLQFTASWCSVCRKEMPFLEEEVWQKYKDDDFVLIGVDYDEPIEKVRAFAEKMKITYPMALDPGGDIFLKFSYKNSGVTRNVVIDKERKIAYLTRLFDREEFDKMKEKIEELMKK